MIFNPFWRGARTPQVKSFTPDETLSYNAESQILSAVPPVSPYGSGTTTGSNTGDQIAATVPYDDTSTVLGATDVQGAIEALDALIGGAGTGDVVGPSVAVNDHVVFFDGTTGKLIKDSGLTLSGTNTGDSGTVTTVSVATANGVSGSVANPTTTPAITLTLGAITPTSVAASGTVTGSNLSGANTGDQTITLTGDVTGSGTGSFAATIANDAVTYAKMQNVTDARLLGRSAGSAGDPQELTVSTGLSLSGGVLTATGGGTGGAGSLYPAFTAPVDGDYAWTNQGSATTTVNANGGIFLFCPKNSGNSMRIRSKAVPGSTPYTLTIAFYPFLVHSQNCGLLVQDNSGNITALTVDVNTGTAGTVAFVVVKFTSPTAFSSAPLIRASVTGGQLVYLQYRDDSTNRIWRYSLDGYNFIDLFSEGRTVFLTATKWGFYANDTGNGTDCGMTLMHASP